MDALDQAIADVDGAQAPAAPAPVAAPPGGSSELAEPAGTRSALSGIEKRNLTGDGPLIHEMVDPGQVQAPQPAAAAPDQPRDQLDAVIAKVDGTDAPQRVQQAGAALQMKSDASGPADRTREVLHYAELLGLPPDVVDKNLEQYKASADDVARGWGEIARSNPALSDWALGGHGMRAGAVKDDLRNLSTLEWAWRAPFAAFKDAAWMLDADVREAIAARGFGGGENLAAAKQIEGQHSGLGYGEEKIPVVGRGLIGLAQALPWMAADEVGRAAGGAAGRLGGAALGAVGTSETGPGAVGGATAGAALGATVGQYGGSFAVNDTLLLGQLNREFSQMRDADGNPLDPQVAHWAAEVTAGLTSTAMAAMGPFGQKLGGVASGKALQAVQKLVLQPGVAGAVLRYGTRFGVHEASAMALGLVQGGLAGAGREGSKLFSGQRFQVDPGSILDDAFGGAANAARDMLLLSGGHAAVETYHAGKSASVARAVQADRAQTVATSESAARLQAINEAAAASKSIPGMPAKDVHELVAQISAGGRAGQVLIDREAVVRLAQERKVDPAELAQDLAGDDGKAWAEANRTGGELAVEAGPYVKFAAKDKDGAGALFQDARLFSEAKTPRQARAADEEFAKRVQERKADNPEEMDPAQHAVYEDWRTKSEAAGRGPKDADANARIVAAAFHTWAERFRENGTETNALELYNHQDATIKGPRGIGLDTSFDPAAIEGEHPVVEDLRTGFAGHVDEPQTETALRRYYEDPVTGLRNERAAAVEPSPKPAVLHFGVEGVKFRNDDLEKGGHNKADELLRAVAQAAHQVDPNVYRAGGDFAVPVKDQAEADAFLQLVREGLPAQAKGYGISGAVGPDLGKARETHDLAKTAAEKAGARVERGVRPLGLPAGHDAGTSITADRVKAQLGEAHAKAFAEVASTKAGREEAFREVHLEPTGILKRVGFDALPKRKYRAAIDLNGLKRVQTELKKYMSDGEAHAFGDRMLEDFGRLAHDSGGLDIDFFRDHGDEYGAQADDPQALQAFLERLFAAAKDTEVEVPDQATGGTWTYKSLIFGFGIGETAHENAAERALNKHKDDLKTEGLRGNEDQPERLFYSPPEAGPDQGGGPRGGHSDSGSGDVGSRDALGAGQGGREVRPAGSGAPGEAGPDQAAGGRVDEGGRPAVAAERPLDVAPGVEIAPSAVIPTEAAMAEADAYVARLKTPERRKAGAAFLDRVRAHLAGDHISSVIGDLPRDIENELARRGVVDPKYGYASAEDLSHRSRGGQRKRRTGASGNEAVRQEKREQLNAIRSKPATKAEVERATKTREMLDPNFKLESRRGRGEITFTPPGSDVRRSFNIKILSGADNSTLAHETFHFLNQVMGDLAQRPDAPAALKSDYAGLLKFMDYESHDQRVAETKELAALLGKEKLTSAEKARKTALQAKEERATHGWEQFLLEGRSPSVELAGVFSRFRNWMVRIYKGLRGDAGAAAANLQEGFRERYGQEIGLSDEVRQIFGRIVAADDEVERAQAAARAQPFAKLFEGATPEERAAYEDAERRKTETAKTEVHRRIAEAQKGENTKFFKDERTTIESEVNAELDKHPVYRAIRYLREGDLPEGPAPAHMRDEHGRTYKLDRKAVVEGFNKDFARTIVEKHGNLFAKKAEHGVPADTLAALLGFDSGKELLDQVQVAEPRAALVASETEKRMTSIWGAPLIDSPGALGAEAIAALHNPDAVRAALLERRRLAKLIDPEKAKKLPPLDEDTLKAAAKSIVAKVSMGALLRGDEGATGYYRRAEKTATERMRKAFDAGKPDEALAENEARLLNMFLWREARDQRQHFESALRTLKQSAAEPWRQQLGKADVAAGDHVYRDAHDAILQAIKLQPRDPSQPPGGALEALIAAVGDEGLGFDPDRLRELMAHPKAWDDLLPAEAQNAHDAVKRIRHAANQQNSLEMEGRRQSLEQLFDDARTELAGLPKTALERMDRARETGFLRSLATLPRRAFQWTDSSLMNIETLLDVLTGGNRDSVLHKIFIDGQLKARDSKEVLGREFLKKLMSHWEELPKELKGKLNDVVDISELAKSEKFQELAAASGLEADGKVSLKYALMMALNMGNAGNKQRLLDGYGWTEEKVMQHLDRIIPKEGWKWVQGVWDSLDSLWPHIARVHEIETGVLPGKVEATKVVTRHGEFRGGYFPAKYDPRTNSRLAQHQVEAAAANMLAPATYGVASVAKGHTQERAAKFEDAIDLDWNVVPGHVANVLHYVAYRPWVREAAKVVANDQFASLVDRYLGKDYTKQFDPWLKAVANMQAQSVPANQTKAVRAVGWLRNRIAVQALGLNLPVALTHLSYPPALALTGEVGPGFMAEACGRTWADWGPKRGWALEQSPELRFRAEQVGGLLRKSLDEMSAQGSPLQRHVEHMAFAFLEWAEKLTATPAWLGRYNQERAGGKDHDAAVREADGMIRRWYISKSMADVPAIIRDKAQLGGLLMFFGYMNKMWNVQRPWAREVHVAFADKESTGGDKAFAAAKFAGKVLALTLTQGIFSEYLGGKGKQDDESYPGWLFRKALVFQASLLPFVGQVVDGLLLGKKISVRQSPGLATAQRVAETIGAGVQAAKGEGDSERVMWDALEQMGIFAPLTPLPTGQVAKSAKYLSHTATGQTSPRGGLDVAGGAVYGSQPISNPLTDAQSLVEMVK